MTTSGREPALDLVETLRQRLLGLALGRQVLDAMGDLLDPVGRGDRSRERGNLVTHGGKALAELVEPLRGGRFLLGREALADVGERRGEGLDPLLELLEAGGIAVVAPRHLVDPHSELGDRGGEALVLVAPASRRAARASIWSASGLAASRSANWVSIRASRSSSSGSPTGRDSSSTTVARSSRERLRLLIEGRGGSGVLGQHGQPLLEGDQRLVQRDDLVRA